MEVYKDSLAVICKHFLQMVYENTLRGVYKNLLQGVYKDSLQLTSWDKNALHGVRKDSEEYIKTQKLHEGFPPEVHMYSPMDGSKDKHFSFSSIHICSMEYRKTASIMPRESLLKKTLHDVRKDSLLSFNEGSKYVNKFIGGVPSESTKIPSRGSIDSLPENS